MAWYRSRDCCDNINYWEFYLHVALITIIEIVKLYCKTHIAKLNKIELEPILDAEFKLLQQILLQYLHLFPVCECGYAN